MRVHRLWDVLDSGLEGKAVVYSGLEGKAVVYSPLPILVQDASSASMKRNHGFCPEDREIRLEWRNTHI